MSTIRVLIIGDVVGAVGRSIFHKHIRRLKTELRIDSVIVNGENSANDGRGVTPSVVSFFERNCVDIITSGNHIWDKKEIYSCLDEKKRIIRPANFPSSAPGIGYGLYACGAYTVGVINVQGRVFMRETLDCPFKTVQSLLTYLKTKTKIIIVDFHAEATSEKMGLAYFLDGQISLLVGTHTHILTADERILPKGTGYITDIGMVGMLNSMLGMKKEPIIERFLSQMPTKFMVEVEDGPALLTGVWCEIDTISGKAVAIGAVRLVDADFHFDQRMSI